MLPRVKFRTIVHRDISLRKAPQVLQKHFKGGLLAVGKRLEASAARRMRKDTGASIKSLTTRVRIKSGINMELIVFSTLIQAFVDAYGLRRGVFPDFRVNSKLYNWVKRRFRGIPNRQVRTVGTPAGPRAVTRRRIKRINRGKRVRRPTAVVSARTRSRVRNTNIKRLTFLVARAIYRRGIAATRWPKHTLEANRTRIVREMQNAISRAVNEINRG